MKFATGKLGWTVYEYYTALPIEFYAAVEGYMEKIEDKAKVIRFAAYRIAESMAGTKALGTIDKFWPMGDIEEEKKLPPMTKERYDAIIQRHKVKVK